MRYLIASINNSSTMLFLNYVFCTDNTISSGKNLYEIYIYTLDLRQQKQ
jgi:hypothetical protein